MTELRSVYGERKWIIATDVLANWEAMERLCKEQPLAINWGPIRPTTPRMIGLHPDHPNPKWKPNRPNDVDRN